MSVDLESVLLVFVVVQSAARIDHLRVGDGVVFVAGLDRGLDLRIVRKRRRAFVPDAPAHQIVLALEFAEEFPRPFVANLLFQACGRRESAYGTCVRTGAYAFRRRAPAALVRRRGDGTFGPRIRSAAIPLPECRRDRADENPAGEYLGRRFVFQCPQPACLHHPPAPPPCSRPVDPAGERAGSGV